MIRPQVVCSFHRNLPHNLNGFQKIQRDYLKKAFFDIA